jgi:hypothetical protein
MEKEKGRDALSAFLTPTDTNVIPVIDRKGTHEVNWLNHCRHSACTSLIGPGERGM